MIDFYKKQKELYPVNFASELTELSQWMADEKNRKAFVITAE